jgi:hypothetical protein
MVKSISYESKVKKSKDLIIKQSTTVLRKPLIFVLISFLIVALIYSSFSRSYVFAAISSGPIICDVGSSGFLVHCCQTTTDDKGIEIHWCTLCDNTHPPSNCSPRHPENAPPPVLPQKLRPPVVTTEPPSVAPPNGSSQTVPGTIEQPPSTVKDNSNTTSPPSTSQRVFSPTGGCVPFTPKTPTGGCIPCDPGLPGGDCIPSGDWRPSGNARGGGSEVGTTPSNVQPPAQGGSIEQSPSNVAPPPSTKTCPDDSAPDANGNCPPLTRGPKEPPPSIDQGATQPPDNKPLKPELSKGDILEVAPTHHGVQ